MQIFLTILILSGRALTFDSEFDEKNQYFEFSTSCINFFWKVFTSSTTISYETRVNPDEEFD